MNLGNKCGNVCTCFGISRKFLVVDEFGVLRKNFIRGLDP